MCGIFGFIGKEPINLSVFTTLGVSNDARGGDSCGIIIDDDVEYGIKECKLFSNFYTESDLLKEIVEKKVSPKIAIGHCRKASVGDISLANAQPVTIFNEKEELEFALIHNGTISNYKSLANKYIPELDINDLTDSGIMAEIIYKSGFDVFGEYVGAGAFVTIDYRKNRSKPIIHIFKGASKQSYSTNICTEERPLSWVIQKNSIWFSSLSEPLSALLFGASESSNVNPNILYRIEEGAVIKEKEIDRTNIAYSNVDSTSVIKGNYCKKKYENYEFNYLDEYQDNDYYNNQYNLNFDTDDNVYNNTSQILNFNYNLNRNNLNFAVNTNVMPNSVYYKDGLYIKNGNPIFGKFKLGFQGIECSESSDINTFYFINGVMMSNRCYYLIEKLSKSLHCENISKLCEIIPELPYLFSTQPRIIFKGDNQKVRAYKYIVDGSRKNKMKGILENPATIKYIPLFNMTPYTLEFRNGNLVSIDKIIGIKEYFKYYKEACSKEPTKDYAAQTFTVFYNYLISTQDVNIPKRDSI